MTARNAIQFLVTECGISEKNAFEKNFIVDKFGDFEIPENFNNEGAISGMFDAHVKNNTDLFGPKFRAFAIEMKNAKDEAFPRISK